MLKLVVQAPDKLPAFPPDSRVIISDPEGTPHAYGSRVGNDCWVSVPNRGTFHFRPGLEFVTAEPDPQADEAAVLDAYRSAALPMAVQVALGSQALHASGVVASGLGVVAFCGLSQSGKSTLAYGLSLRGYPIWADDVLALDASDGESVRSLRLPFRLNLRAASVAHFDAADTDVCSADDDAEAWTRVPLAAIFALERTRTSTGRRESVRRLAPDDGLIAVLENAFFFQPQTKDERRRMMRDYLEVIARVPVFALDVPPTLETLDALLDELEANIQADV